MRKNITRTTLLAVVLAAITGCSTTTGGSPKMSFWPFNKKAKPAETAVANGPPPAWPVTPSSAATPSATPTGGAAARVASTAAPATGATAASPYSYPATPAGYPAGPAVEYGTPVDASPYAAPAGYNAAAAPRVAANANPNAATGAQVGRYDANAYSPTRPAAYNQPAAPAAPAAPAGRYEASPYDASPYDAPPSQPGAPASRYDSYPETSSAPATNGRAVLPRTETGTVAYDVPPAGDERANERYEAPGHYETPTAEPAYAGTQENNYQPGATDYQPGQTGYAPAGTDPYSSPAPRYESPSNVRAESASDPHYRPGSTSDYAGAKPASKPATSTASKPGSRPATSTSRYGTSEPAGIPQANPYAAPLPSSAPAGGAYR